MLRFPDALRIFMAHFFDLERKGARLLRPLLRGVDAGRLIPGEDFFDAFEKLYETVDAVQRILLDGTRTSARLIVNPTRIVVDESRRAFSYLSLHGIVTDAVIVNRVMPESAGRGYFRRWVEHERAELARIEADFPVPILQSGLRTAEVIGIPSLEELAGELFGLMDPAAPLSKGQPLRVRGSEGLLCLEIDLPGVAVEEVEVQMKGDELLLRVRDARRVLALPESLVGRPLERVRLRSSTLEIGFGHG
jgi:arsenite-transporting ATPase